MMELVTNCLPEHIMLPLTCLRRVTRHLHNLTLAYQVLSVATAKCVLYTVALVPVCTRLCSRVSGNDFSADSQCSCPCCEPVT